MKTNEDCEFPKSTVEINRFFL